MNKGMFGFPDKRRYKNFYGFPKKRLLKPVGRNFPRSNEDYDFKIDVPTNQVVQLITNSFLDTTYVVDWGDGTLQTFVGTGVSVSVSATGDVTYSGNNVNHTYAIAGKYNIKVISGEESVITLYINAGTGLNLIGNIKEEIAIRFSNLECFKIVGNNFLTGTIPSNFSNLNLILFSIYSTTSNQIYLQGSFPNVDNWTKLKYFELNNALYLTDFPSFYNCINLIYFSINNWWSLSTQELPSFENCTELYYFNISQPYQRSGYLGSFEGFIGTLPSFNNCTKLTQFLAGYTNFYGVAPSFSNCTSLIVFTLNRFAPTLTYRFTNDISDLGLNTCTSLESIRLGGEQYTDDPSLKDYTDSPVFDLTNLTSLIQFNVYYINSTLTNPRIYSIDSLITYIARGCQNFSGTLTIDTSILRVLSINYSNISNVDFSNLIILNYIVCANSPCALTWPMGTKVFPCDTGADGRFYVNGTGMTSTQINDSINNIYVNRNSFNNVRSKPSLWNGASNGTPSGTYQAPAGYIQATTGVTGNDGTPASAKEQIYVLVNQNIDNTTTKKYNWTFTTN